MRQPVMAYVFEKPSSRMVRSLNPGIDMIEKCSPSKMQPAIDLVRQHHDVAIADAWAMSRYRPCENSAGRILRRVEDDQPGPIGNQGRQFVQVERRNRALRAIGSEPRRPPT